MGEEGVIVRGVGVFLGDGVVIFVLGEGGVGECFLVSDFLGIWKERLVFGRKELLVGEIDDERFLAEVLGIVSIYLEREGLRVKGVVEVVEFFLVGGFVVWGDILVFKGDGELVK